jgi:hypothetical protein
VIIECAYRMKSTDTEYVPSFCSCVDGNNYASTLKCSVNLLDKLEVGLIGQLSPCALPATISLDISAFDSLKEHIAETRLVL